MDTKIAWLTDPHLNFLKSPERETFYQQIKQAEVNSVLITGDIAESKDVCELLNEFSVNINLPIYFVLGNHDYYFGSVAEVRENIRRLCKSNKDLIWLGQPAIIKLDNKTALVGHDGWADARYGDFEHSTVALNDSRLITNLYQVFLLSKSALKNEMQRLADEDAAVLANTIYQAIDGGIKNIIVATHIPPFPECSWHENQPNDENWLPYFSSKATGDVLRSIAEKYKHVNFLVLCGHTHSEAKVKFSDNLEIRVGKAEYYQPSIQEIITI
ncbi:MULTISPECIES: metallophosphoesterase [unclassified Legionella]|uniref:metallophosphoesterase family protein n=1 Tax=unclassified Legionella TaxID=2622702 RepID=UPI0010547867|nr:metallophosphoesterase [Legionella sp. W10-070]MDI9819821.1 metallophosphoesterase [Legionella sp. PL877]